MQELIKIESAPARLGANFAEVKARLKAELAKYDVLVTAETLADAKKLATELNQTAKAIDDRRKAEVAAVSEPIRIFDSQMKELVTLCRDGRQKLLDQIKTFEDETREKARTLLVARRNELWEQHGVELSFRRAEIADLVMLTAVTKAGNLAAKAANELEARVLADKSLQDRTDRRLLALENASYKAGLSAPLTRDHVAGFLMADDETYSAELERIIAAEIRREEEAQRRMRERLEREQREREQREREQKEREEKEREEKEREEKEREEKEREEKERREREAREAAQRVEDEEGSRDDDPAFNEAATGDLMAQADYYDQLQQELDAEPWTEPAEEPEPEAPQAPGKVRVAVRATFTPEVPASATDAQIEAALRAAMAKAGITTLTDIEILRDHYLEADE